MTKTVLTAVLVVACGAFACGGSSDAGAIDTSVNDGGTTFADGGSSGDDGGTTTGDGATTDAPAGDTGMPSGNYPAFPPFMGELVNNGGPVLSAPKIVTVTWPNDNSTAILEDFGDKIGASQYWQTAVGEYGVGAATSGAANHVHVATAPPAQMSDQDIRNFIAANAGSVLPAPTSQTMYMLWLHPNTKLMFGGGEACASGIGGYHNDTTVNGTIVAYGVVPRCGSIQSATSAGSHEIGEAATDPQPSGSAGWVGFSDATTVFNLWQRNNVENGDACEFFKDSFYTDTGLGYAVQRLWSNKQGALGHSPCQPFTGTYFNVTPLGLQDLVVDLSQAGGTANTHTKGFHAAQGETITFEIGFYSDGPTSGPWTVKAYESNPLVNPVTGRLTVAVDPMKTTGVNGEKTKVSVTVTQAGPAKVELMTLVSTLGAVSHYMPVLIGSN